MAKRRHRQKNNCLRNLTFSSQKILTTWIFEMPPSQWGGSEYSWDSMFMEKVSFLWYDPPKEIVFINCMMSTFFFCSNCILKIDLIFELRFFMWKLVPCYIFNMAAIDSVVWCGEVLVCMWYIFPECWKFLTKSISPDKKKSRFWKWIWLRTSRNPPRGSSHPCSRLKSEN